MNDRRSASPDLILVTGATGKTGTQTVRLLREHGFAVRALVRTMDDRAARLAGWGAQVVVGDLLSFASVRAATEGVTAAYFSYPPGVGYVEAAVNFAQAAGDAGVQAVVELSQIGVRPTTTHIGLEHWLVERLFDRAPFPTTHLRPTLFINWLNNFWIRSGEREGILRLPLGERPHAPIAMEDQARIVVSILQNPSPHGGRTYELFGAEELDWHAIAIRVGAALGWAVSYDPVDVATMTAALAGAGIDAKRVHHLGMVAQDYRDGYYSGFNDLVTEITGTKPVTIEEHVAATRATFDTNGDLALTDDRLQRR